RLLYGAAAARLDRLAVEARRPALAAQPALGEARRLDDPHDGALALHERDQRAEQREAGDEALGAVDRIEHPGELALALGGKFLAADGVRREGRADHAPHDGLDVAVGDRDRAAVALALHRQHGAEVLPRDAARGVGELPD